MNTERSRSRHAEALTEAERIALRARREAVTVEAVAVAARCSVATVHRAAAGKAVTRAVRDALVRAIGTSNAAAAA